MCHFLIFLFLAIFSNILANSHIIRDEIASQINRGKVPRLSKNQPFIIQAHNKPLDIPLAYEVDLKGSSHIASLTSNVKKNLKIKFEHKYSNLLKFRPDHNTNDCIKELLRSSPDSIAYFLFGMEFDIEFMLFTLSQYEIYEAIKAYNNNFPDTELEKLLKNIDFVNSDYKFSNLLNGISQEKFITFISSLKIDTIKKYLSTMFEKICRKVGNIKMPTFFKLQVFSEMWEYKDIQKIDLIISEHQIEDKDTSFKVQDVINILSLDILLETFNTEMRENYQDKLERYSLENIKTFFDDIETSIMKLKEISIQGNHTDDIADIEEYLQEIKTFENDLNNFLNIKKQYINNLKARENKIENSVFLSQQEELNEKYFVLYPKSRLKKHIIYYLKSIIKKYIPEQHNEILNEPMNNLIRMENHKVELGIFMNGAIPRLDMIPYCFDILIGSLKKKLSIVKSDKNINQELPEQYIEQNPTDSAYLEQITTLLENLSESYILGLNIHYENYTTIRIIELLDDFWGKTKSYIERDLFKSHKRK